jgi:hypothetical protein
MLNVEVVAAAIDRERMADMLERVAREIRAGAPPTGPERRQFVFHGYAGSYWLQDTEVEQASWATRKG